MFNPFKSFSKKREIKRQTKRLTTISSLFGSMAKLFESGLLHWNRRHRRLFIAEPLAVVMLDKGSRHWTNFLNNVYQYVMYIHISELWRQRLANEQSRAVAEARRRHPFLSAAEIQRLRRGAAASLAEDDVAIPKVGAFEFYVISDSGSADAETTLCGTYDPEADFLDIVSWEEIQTAVSAYHK